MTQHAMAIKVNVGNDDEAKKICDILKSDEMSSLIDSCLYSSYAIDWNIFKDMKKNFWEYI